MDCWWPVVGLGPVPVVSSFDVPRGHFSYLERTAAPPAARRVPRAPQHASTPPKPEPTRTRQPRRRHDDRSRQTDPTVHDPRRAHQRVPPRRLNHPAAPAHHRGLVTSRFTAPARTSSLVLPAECSTPPARAEFSAPSGTATRHPILRSTANERWRRSKSPSMSGTDSKRWPLVGFSGRRLATRFGESGEQTGEQTPSTTLRNARSRAQKPGFSRVFDGGGGRI